MHVTPFIDLIRCTVNMMVFLKKHRDVTSDNCLNSGLHEAEIPALLFIFSLFWRLLAQMHALFQAFALRSAYIPEKIVAVVYF